MALQGDGKIVAVGRGGPLPHDFAIARYNPDGSLDPGFSGDGRQTTDFGGSDDGARGVATQTDDKIVVVGRSGVPSRSPATTRTGRSTGAFPATAGRRPTSGTAGTGRTGWRSKQTARSSRSGVAAPTPTNSRSPATTRAACSTRASPATVGRPPISGGLDSASARPLQPERLARLELLGGGAGPGTQTKDDRIGRETWMPPRENGAERMGARRALRSAAVLVAVMVVAVVSSAGAKAAPGDLDPTFSGDGRQRTDFRSGLSQAAATVRQPDGKIVVIGVGVSGGGDGGDFALARYNPNGSLDPSFSGDGRQTTDFAGLDSASAVALQADGKIVAVGEAGVAVGARDFALARYNPSGSLDPSFSGDGRQTTDFGGVDDGASGVAIQADGKIVVVGHSSRRRRLRARPLQPERLARHELLRRRQADDRLRRLRPGDRGGDSGGRQDRRGRVWRYRHRRLRARPLQPERLARPELLRRRQADDRLRGLSTRASGGGDPGGRQDRRGRRQQRGRRPRLRARPLQPGRLARPELLRRRQADDRLRRLRPGDRGGDPGGRQDRRGRRLAVPTPATSRSPATTRTARSTRASPATASRRPTSEAPTGRPGWRSRRTARSSRSGLAVPTPATSRSPATTRAARSTRASPATAGRRPTSGASTL